MIAINLKNPLTKTLLDKWADLTEWNYHNEVRVEIAKWCDSNGLVNEELFIDPKYRNGWENLFSDLTEEIESKNGYSKLLGVRCVLTDLMLREIRENFGKEVYKKIHNCL